MRLFIVSLLILWSQGALAENIGQQLSATISFYSSQRSHLLLNPKHFFIEPIHGVDFIEQPARIVVKGDGQIFLQLNKPLNLSAVDMLQEVYDLSTQELPLDLSEKDAEILRQLRATDIYSQKKVAYQWIEDIVDRHQQGKVFDIIKDRELRRIMINDLYHFSHLQIEYDIMRLFNARSSAPSIALVGRMAPNAYWDRRKEGNRVFTPLKRVVELVDSTSPLMESYFQAIDEVTREAVQIEARGWNRGFEKQSFNMRGNQPVDQIIEGAGPKVVSIFSAKTCSKVFSK